MPSLTRQVGLLWAKSQLPIYVEQLFSTFLEIQLVREATLFKAASLPPSILLTTPAGEKHTLGLAMALAVLSEAGIPCLRLPSDLPSSEIAASALSCGVNAVGLSASLHYPPRLLSQQLFDLRAQLGDDVELWLGGNGAHRVSKIPCGTQVFTTWPALIERANALQSHRTNKETP